jgi:hypothetical protein
MLWGPSSLLFSGYWASFPGAKRPGREVYHSHPSTSEVKNKWNYTSSPLICLHSMDQDNSSFLTLDLSAQPWNMKMVTALPTVQRNGYSDDSASPTYDITTATSLEMWFKWQFLSTRLRKICKTETLYTCLGYLLGRKQFCMSTEWG